VKNYTNDRKDPLDAQRAQDGEKTRWPFFKFAWNENDFTPLQREWIAMGVNAASRLGPTCVWVVDGTHDILVRHWPEDNSVNPTTNTTPNAGLFTILPDGSREIWLDPTGLHGEAAWTIAAAQETIHAFGVMSHVPRALGSAIMNPVLPELTFNPDPAVTDLDGDNGPRYPTQLDQDEYDRVHGRKP